MTTSTSTSLQPPFMLICSALPTARCPLCGTSLGHTTLLLCHPLNHIAQVDHLDNTWDHAPHLPLPHSPFRHQVLSYRSGLAFRDIVACMVHTSGFVNTISLLSGYVESKEKRKIFANPRTQSFHHPDECNVDSRSG